jgi:GxxExxY protein
MDFVVEDSVVVEIKAVDTLLPIHEAQILTYLKLGKYKVGLLINFNEKVLNQGVKRFILDEVKSSYNKDSSVVSVRSVVK